MNAAAEFRFRLFVAGGTPNSIQALGNLQALGDTRLPGRHEIEVIDVLREPERALAEGIFMTPTLVKLAPGTVLRIVGTLNSSVALALALGLHGFPA